MYEKSKQFFNHFNSIFNADNFTREIAIAQYPHKKSFTEFITSQINRIIESQDLHPQNEYFRIDVMGYKSRWRELEAMKGLNPYLWDLEIAVEHENDDAAWLDEVIKLAHISCPLRVVIGYVSCNKRQDDVYLLDYATQALKKLNCINTILNGEFLIILGNSKTKGNIENYFHYKPYILDTNNFQFIPLEL